MCVLPARFYDLKARERERLLCCSLKAIVVVFGERVAFVAIQRHLYVYISVPIYIASPVWHMRNVSPV